MQTEKPENEGIIANLEAERQLLGRLLLDNEFFWNVSKILKPDHFATRVHRDIFQHMGELITTNRVANPVTLQAYITYEINYKPPVRYLLALVGDATSAVNMDDYALNIVNLALRRQLSDGAAALIEQAQTMEVLTPVSKILESADMIFSDIRLSVPGSLINTTSISAVCDESFERLVDLLDHEVSPYPEIGLKGVTRLMGPLTPGCVYVIAGRPGSGKTAAAVAAARAIMRQHAPDGSNFGVAFFTLEVTKSDLWNRFVACEMALSNTPVYYMALKRGSISKAQLGAVKYFSDALKKFPLSIDDKSGLTVAEIFIRARAEKQRLEKQGVKLAIVVIDYLQIIKPSGRYSGNKVAEVSEISTALVTLAKDLGVAVVAVSQLSRNVEQRADKRPIMSDLRESGQIEQDANSIIFLFRPAYYDNLATEGATPETLEIFQARENDLHYIVAKARDGIPGEVITYCDIGKNHIANRR